PSLGQDKGDYDMINFPRLLHLVLQGSGPLRWFYHFLSHIRCPRLQKVHLKALPFQRPVDPASSSVDVRDVLHLPPLSFFSMRLDEESPNLELMDLFSYIPIKTLNMQVEG